MHDTEPTRAKDRAPAPPLNPEPPAEPRTAPPRTERLPMLPAVPPGRQRVLSGKPAPPPGGSELDRQRPVDIDRRSWQKLKRGEVRIDGRVDLHGLTQAEAHARLDEFLLAMSTRGARCVLVITGLGRVDGGILRQMTPRWLKEPANCARIVTFTQAQLKHGGAGALYVLLKRQRPKG